MYTHVIGYLLIQIMAEHSVEEGVYDGSTTEIPKISNQPTAERNEGAALQYQQPQGSDVASAVLNQKAQVFSALV